MKGKLLLGMVGGLTAMVAAGLSSGTASAGITITVCLDSKIGQMQNCTYERDYGVQSIFITNVAEDGTQVVVWNQAHDCESPVEVSYIRVGPTGFHEIEECAPPVGVGQDDPGSFQIETPPPSEPAPVLGLKGEPSQADARGPVIPVEDDNGKLWLCREDEEAKQSICIPWPQPEESKPETPAMLTTRR